MLVYIKRYIMLAVALFIMAFGVALSTKAALGVSPVSCVPYILSLALPFSMGTITMGMHVVFILIQMALLRRDFEAVQFLQLGVAVLFGFFTDLTLYLVRDLSVSGYAAQWALCLSSFVVVAFGLELEVRARVVMLAGEGVMTAISRVFSIEFPKVKTGFDLSQVLLGLVLSFSLLGHLVGIREGTIAAALVIGLLVKCFISLLSPTYRRWGLDWTPNPS